MEGAAHRQWRALTQDDMERFLREHSYGRLGLCVDDEPYVVPVAYKYDEGSIYFHSEKVGKKLDFIRKNNRVCFEIDEWEEGWASVMCFGRIALRDDFETKKKCFELLMGQELPEDRIKGTNVYIGIIEIEEMTGRCSGDFKFSQTP